eukprot:705500-Rhodomonas_salina.1
MVEGHYQGRKLNEKDHCGLLCKGNQSGKSTRYQVRGPMLFDELAATLREPNMLDVMSKAVLRVFYLSFGRRGTRRIAEANLNIRVFLAAYMITFRPKF